jgi:hypothetical protein
LDLDLLGSLIIVGTIACLISVLQGGGVLFAWNSAKSIGLFVGSGLLLIIFVIIQLRRGENATIPPRIFRQRTILGGSLYFFFAELAIFTVSSIKLSAPLR